MRYLILGLLLGLAATPLSGSQTRKEIVLADFEGRTYGDWQTTGTAFGSGPAQGTLPGQMAVNGYLGHGLVNSFLGGDTAIGTLTSPSFKITRRYINFLIGGGKHPGQTGLSLLIDGKPARAATGGNEKAGGSERLDWQTWDVTDLEGKTAQIEIMDTATEGWGHINVDQITESDAKQAEDIRTAPLYEETYRPQFHFTSKTNWLNDPNGLVYYQGEYHLFFQHNPFGKEWGNMTWGHAISRDLVHWQQLPNALDPDKLGTMFSGSAVVDANNTSGFGTGGEKPLVAVYTAAGDTSPESKGQPFTQCLAYSTDKGRTWTKYAQNPVVPHIAGGNRDPKIVWHAPTHRWIMALYLDKEDFTLLSSPDLKTWTKLQTLTLPGCSECPDFFEMPIEGDKSAHKWVFTAANGHYLVGSFDGAKFTPETSVLQADYGANYYAVQTYSDVPDGRRIQIAWMTGGSYPQMPFNQQMSFPCAMTLHSTPDGPRLYRNPVKEIAGLYEKPLHHGAQTLKAGDALDAAPNGDTWDVQAEFELENATAFGLRARGEDIRYDVAGKSVTCLGRKAPLAPADKRIILRALVDRSSLEVFGNQGQTSLTSCFLPRQQEKGLSVYAEGGSVKLVSLTVHPLRSAWHGTEK